jgi:hypothetical protein
VNTATADAQRNPAVAADADGDFVVAWTNFGRDASGRIDTGVYAQRYTAAGAAAGGEFLVNFFTTGNQLAPSSWP